MWQTWANEAKNGPKFDDLMKVVDYTPTGEFLNEMGR